MTVRTYSVSAEGAQSLNAGYSTPWGPATVCRDKGHDFSGKTCMPGTASWYASFCGQTVS